MKKLFSLYHPSYERHLAYMLQASEYDIKACLHWWVQTKDFSKVSNRGNLQPTSFGKIVHA